MMPFSSNVDDRCEGQSLIRLLALFLAFAIAPPVLLAQEWDDDNDRDHERNKAHDPTGAWLLNTGTGFALDVFHQGGTFTGDIQGENAFVPGGQLPLNLINTPEGGVWQKTGARTFAVTFLTLEYQVQTSALNAPLYQFDKVQFTGVLNESGDQMEITAAVITTFNPDGSLKESITVPSKAHGVRIPLEILPHTSNSLCIPRLPTTP